MAFTGFPSNATDFFFELEVNNERLWFAEHKDTFEKTINKPIKALTADTLEMIRNKYPKQNWSSHLSRIYRDSRRLYGRPPYNNHLWFTIFPEDTGNAGPVLWFEISATEMGWGFGTWSTTADSMAAFRKCIDENPEAFEKIAKWTENLKDVKISGNPYKRPKLIRGSIIDNWYNMKWVGAEYHCPPEESGDSYLPERIVAAFDALMPMYDFCIKAYRRSLTK